MTKNDHQRLLCRFDIARVYLPSALRPSSPELCMQCPWWFFKFNDGCQLSLLDLHPGISPEEVVEDVQVRAVLGSDDLRAAADHPAKKLMDFEHGLRHGSILLHLRLLDCWVWRWVLHCMTASWPAGSILEPAGRGLKSARASKSAGSASEPVVRASTTVGTSWKGFQTKWKGLQTKWKGLRTKRKSHGVS